MFAIATRLQSYTLSNLTKYIFIWVVYSLPEFTHGGKWEVVDDWRNDANGVTHSLIWTLKAVQDFMNQYEVRKGPK